MTIEEVILAVINEYGSDVLNSEKKFFSLIQDYNNNSFSNSEDFLDLKACYANGLWKFAKDIYYAKDAAKLEEIFLNVQRYLVVTKRLSETSVISGINILLKAFGKKYQLVQIRMGKNGSYVVKENVESLKDNENKCEECLFIHNISVTSKKWFLERLSRALAKDAEAMLDIADCYRKGNIVQKNWRLAEKWYKDVIEDNKEKNSAKVVEKAKEKLVELYNELDDCYYR